MGRPWAWQGLLGAIVATALLAGCRAEPPKEAQGRDLVRPQSGFAIDVPAGWSIKDLYGDVVVEMQPQAGPTAQATARDAPAAGPGAAVEAAGHAGPPPSAVVHVVVVDRDDLALEAWADQAVADSRELQSDLEVSGRAKTRLADGREALTLTLKNPRGLKPLVQRLLLAVTERRAYAVLATAAEPDLPAAEPAFKKCFDSFLVW